MHKKSSDLIALFNKKGMILFLFLEFLFGKLFSASWEIMNAQL